MTQRAGSGPGRPSRERTTYPPSEVSQMVGMVWRVMVADPLVSLTHSPAGTVRTIIGRVEWHGQSQMFRAVLDEIRQQEPDGQTMSIPVYLSPGAAQSIRQMILLAWMDHYTDPALHSGSDSPIRGSLGGQIPLPALSPYPEHPPGQENALEGATGAGEGAGEGNTGGQPGHGRAGRKRKGPITSPLSGLVDPAAADVEAAFGEIETLIQILRSEE